MNPEKDTPTQFMADLSSNTGISQQIADQIRNLVDSYKKSNVETGDVIITVETGSLFGHITSRWVSEIKKPVILEYQEGRYDYITITLQKEEIVLWTDFSDNEPFNRRGCLYIPHRFNSLQLVNKTNKYREFIYNREGKYNISFGISWFHYNSFWKQVDFGICVKNSDAEIFISKLRKLLDK